MAIRFTSSKLLFKKKKRTKGNATLLGMLERYITDTQAGPASTLTKFWANQSAALTYKKIEEMIENKEVSTEELENWTKDYTHLVDETFLPLWREAILAGQMGDLILDSVKDKGFEFDMTDTGIQKWMKERKQKFVLDNVHEQQKAFQKLIDKGIEDRMSTYELGRLIRPSIGLNSRQITANANYYESVCEKLRKDHPRMKETTIVQRATKKAERYRQKQLKYRAETIAGDQISEAYNVGAHEGIKQAQEAGYLGKMQRVWVTARQKSVCKDCELVEGVVKEMEEYFDVGKCGPKLIPPAHPR